MFGDLAFCIKLTVSWSFDCWILLLWLLLFTLRCVVLCCYKRYVHVVRGVLNDSEPRPPRAAAATASCCEWHEYRSMKPSRDPRACRNCNRRYLLQFDSLALGGATMHSIISANRPPVATHRLHCIAFLTVRQNGMTPIKFIQSSLTAIAAEPYTSVWYSVWTLILSLRNN